MSDDANETARLKSRTKRSLAWAGGEAMLRALLQFAVLLVFARLVTPGQFGIVAAAGAVLGVANLLAQLGVGPALVQRSALTPGHGSAAFSAALILGVLMGALVAVFAPAIAGLFRLPGLAAVLQLLSIVFPIASLGVVPEAMWQRELRFDRLARVELASYALGYVAVGMTLAFRGWGEWALAAAMLAQASLKTVLLWMQTPWRPTRQWTLRDLQDLSRFGGGTSVAQLANYVAVQGDNFIVGRALGAELLGFYSRAYQVMSQPAYVIGGVLEKVLFPALAKVQNDSPRLARVYLSGSRSLATLLLPMGVFAVWVAPETIRLLLGKGWEPAVVPLQVFAAAMFFRTAIKFNNALIRACGAVYTLAVNQSCYAAMVLVGAWVGSRWGLFGVAAGVFVAIAGVYGSGALICLRLVGASKRALLRGFLPSLALTAICGLISWLVVSQARANALPPAAVIALAALAVGLIGVGVIVGCAPHFPEFAQVREFLKNRRKSQPAPLARDCPTGQTVVSPTAQG